jgi:RimJ/RimL family protein N-acetyltransferase
VAEVVFETPRLIGRRVEAGDREPMLAVYGDADGMRWVGDGRPLTAEDCDRWLSVTAENYRRRGYGMFALVERATGAVIGFCGLVHPQQQAEAELKYALLRSAWGRGLATEAARGLLDHAATTLRLGRVMATVAPEHLASQHVLEKAGMTRGALRDNDDGSKTQLFHWRSPLASAGAVAYADYDDPPAELLRAVDDGLDRHNQGAAPLGDVRALGAFAREAGGEVIGGAVGRTWGRCCELQQLWVAARHRHAGVASELLRRFEAMATARGCDTFYLTTLSFQAPGFYRRHGYVVRAEIRGYPEEIAKFLMYKETKR